MAASLLSDLPSDILLMICEFLYETSPSSLIPFSLGNKTLRKSAEAFIYRDVTVRISTPKELRLSVADLTEGDVGTKVQRHTRFISFRDPMLTAELDRGTGDFADAPGQSKYERKPRYFLQRGPTVPYFPPTGPTVDAHPDISTAWAPLLALISKPQHLVRLTYSCGNKVPPSLVQALQQYHPACKLTINFWWLQSLNEPITDPDETSLVTLQCLDTIRFVTRSGNGPGNDALRNFNQQALLQTISLAPNLRHLRVSVHGASRMVVVPPWQGFSPPPIKPWKKGELESLSISGYRPFDEAVLKKWSSVTDFAKLKVFECFSALHLRTLSPLYSQFSALHTLIIDLEAPASDTDAFMVSLSDFFTNLPPLLSLTALGSINTPIIEAITQRHGPALRQFHLTPPKASPKFGPYTSHTWLTTPSTMITTATDLNMIAASCQALEVFSTTITRSNWNEDEMECYKALSTFPSLRRLSISLDLGDNPPPDETLPVDWDETDREVIADSAPYPRPSLHAGHFRELLSNAPIDDQLAWSIWSLVQPSHGRSPLRELSIGGAPIRHRGLYFDALYLKVRFMQGDMTFESTGHVADTKVRLHGGDRQRRSREWTFEKVERWWNWETDEEFGESAIGKVMRRLWPPVEGRAWSWRSDYCSTPLPNAEM